MALTFVLGDAIYSSQINKYAILKYNKNSDVTT